MSYTRPSLRTVTVVRAWLVLLSLVAACSAPHAEPDARDVGSDAVTDVGVATCHSDTECSDHIFCNGAERCMPGAGGSDARGCAPASPPSPCASGESCDESAQRCSSSCADADHDGHAAASCGGDDCDDTDPNRFPGNPEVCPFNASAMSRAFPTHDEDCDANTVSNATSHDGDYDGDGYIDSACCNSDAMGHMHCGDDCHDTTPDTGFIGMPWMTSVPPAQIHPTQAEVCNGVDDNCNMQIDEDVRQDFYPDCDGDLFGDQHGAAVSGCYTRQSSQCNGHDAVTNNTDCSDTAATVHTGVAETCNGVDDNCDGTVDEEPAASMACVTSSGATLICMSGSCAVSGCAPGSRDCDGIASNGCECVGPMHGAPMCTGSTCAFGCNSGYHACGATCADNTALASCGSSCVACPTTGANVISPTCDGVSCGFVCASGAGDCNHVASDGCETSLLNDPQNCGACGNVCAGFPAAFCVAGACHASTGSRTFNANGTFTVPAGVYTVSVIAVGAGGGGGGENMGGGGGGALCYANPVAVTPGATIAIVVGAAGGRANGGDSSFNGSIVAQGGRVGTATTGGLGGVGMGMGTCFAGGAGGNNVGGSYHRDPGGGGAGGYAGPGGRGSDSSGSDYGLCTVSAGTGGAGGGGAPGNVDNGYGGAGGGVGLLGPGADGAAGSCGSFGTRAGGGGSGGGAATTVSGSVGVGGSYGGGGDGAGTGGPGAVRVIW